jgi:Uma2 family endonuclease
MSIANSQANIEYPESDGKPMGETDLHRDWMVRILDILRYRYRDQRVYVASDLLVYYEEGVPSRFVVPDDFVVLDCDPRRRRVFKSWEEARSPDVVFEVTSRATSQQDLVDKPPVYERIGVKEYFLYDPSGVELSPPLQGYRLTDGALREIKELDGKLCCQTLGIDLHLDGNDLVLTDIQSARELLTEADSERRAKESERRAKESERRAKESERRAKEAERLAKEAEQTARQAAEARVLELEKELKRLRGGEPE